MSTANKYEGMVWNGHAWMVDGAEVDSVKPFWRKLRWPDRFIIVGFVTFLLGLFAASTQGKDHVLGFCVVASVGVVIMALSAVVSLATRPRNHTG